MSDSQETYDNRVISFAFLFKLENKKVECSLIESLEFPPVQTITSYMYTNADSRNVITDIYELDCVIPNSDVLSYLTVQEAFNEEIEEVKIKSIGSFSLQSLRKLQRLHQLVNLKEKVKEENKWFHDRENELRPQNNCLPLREKSIKECHNLLLSKSNGAVVFEPSTVQADIASICCNQWLSLGAITMFAHLINKHSTTSRVLVLNNLHTSEQAKTKLYDPEQISFERVIIILNVGIDSSTGETFLREFKHKGIISHLWK